MSNIILRKNFSFLTDFEFDQLEQGVSIAYTYYSNALNYLKRIRDIYKDLYNTFGGDENYYKTRWLTIAIQHTQKRIIQILNGNLYWLSALKLDIRRRIETCNDLCILRGFPVMFSNIDKKVLFN